MGGWVGKVEDFGSDVNWEGHEVFKGGEGLGSVINKYQRIL